MALLFKLGDDIHSLLIKKYEISADRQIKPRPHLLQCFVTATFFPEVQGIFLGMECGICGSPSSSPHSLTFFF